jgi:hypothetical protein
VFFAEGDLVNLVRVDPRLTHREWVYQTIDAPAPHPERAAAAVVGGSGGRSDGRRAAGECDCLFVDDGGADGEVAADVAA